MHDEPVIARAADLIASADALLVAAGAGMGIDSGLPDFRGPEGFWRAYPALGRRRLQFYEVASPRTFDEDPATAWGFYGHRLNLYRRTMPHAGFDILRRWGEGMFHSYDVFTSNVDGQFQRAGFNAESIAECHGSIHHLQCSKPCGTSIWPADFFIPEVDHARCELVNAAPICPECGALARPNIMMFGDFAWHEWRSAVLETQLRRWLDGASRLVVVEIGAGSAIPSVRHFSHEMVLEHGARLIRINPREPAVPSTSDVSIAAPALLTLMEIENLLAGH
jgi:NAD-dependent SIR2 family protein deacetylase